MITDLVRWRELDDWATMLFPSAAETVQFTGEPAIVQHRGREFTLIRYIDPNLREHVQVWGPPAFFPSQVT